MKQITIDEAVKNLEEFGNVIIDNLDVTNILRLKEALRILGYHTSVEVTMEHMVLQLKK